MLFAALRSHASMASLASILATCKTSFPPPMPVERISEAIEAGLTEFGENRVQEAEKKFAVANMEANEAIDDGNVARNSITLHLIGSLQRNKVRPSV